MHTASESAGEQERGTGERTMSAIHRIPVGTTAEQSVIVTPDLTISSIDARLPSVLATPAMINFMEITAARAIGPFLAEGWISVGVLVNVRHLAATPEGATVRVTAKVIEINNKRITFAVEAYDHVEKIGEGTHVRAVVERSRFLRMLEYKSR
jgi:predicted thioesterase